MATVSAIIPVFNRRDKIGRALDSVMSQTLAPNEIIVVDDGSTDGTAEFVADNYPQAMLLRQKNLGPGAARNTGIAAANGDLIAFLDSDDIWLPDKIRMQVEVMDSHPELGMLATQKKYRFPSKSVSYCRPQVRYFPFSAFMKRTKFNTPTIVIRREVLAEVGLFDTEQTTSEDWDLWARVAYRYSVARIEQPLVVVLESADSISRSRKVKYFNDIKVLARWNPKKEGTYDTGNALSPLLYQRYVTGFAVVRGLKLYKHFDRDTANCFLQEVEEKTGLARPFKLLVKFILRMYGICRKTCPAFGGSK